MSSLLHLFFLGLITLSCAEHSSNFDRIRERLEKSGKQTTIVGYSEAPEAASYLNHDLTQNTPHKVDLTKEITKLIRDWTPRLLALDPTCPYYFSKLSDPAVPEEDLNLLSYLLAVESNKTLAHPFVNILPQSYRNAVPLLSIFRCSELVYSTSGAFFHNVELIIGPGKTELPFQRQSDTHSQLYCSLNGWPHIVLVDRTQQSTTTTFNADTFLAEGKLDDVSFLSTSVAPGTCLYVPSGWVVGGQLNNSISLAFTLKNIEKPTSDAEPLACSSTGDTTIDHIDFTITDQFNLTNVGLVVYFYQYLNPPIFDRQYDNKEFFDHFRNDRNLSQLVMKWTPDLIDLVNNTLFRQLDLNADSKFSVDDYFQIKQSNLNALQNAVHGVLEKLRQIIMVQYNDLSATISKISDYVRDNKDEDNTHEALGDLMNNLPETIKEKLAEKNVNVADVLSKLNTKKKEKPSTNKPRVREEDAFIAADAGPEQDIGSQTEQEQEQEDEEEEITAEPSANQSEHHRTDL